MFSSIMARQPRVAVAVLVVAMGLALFQAPAFAAGGVVLPPTAMPNGFSLTKVAVATAQFNTSDHSGAQPSIPFQMLATTSTNTFTVRNGTRFYVPLAQADDSPPILGDFPTSSIQANGYFFGSSQLGGHDFKIIVDGTATRVGSDFLVGPVKTPPLSDGGGTHYMTLAVFLSPLTPGDHTVTIEGQFSGKVVTDFFGGPLDFTIPYTVKVQ